MKKFADGQLEHFKCTDNIYYKKTLRLALATFLFLAVKCSVK